MAFEHWLQSRLTAHGFPVGVIDGKIGPETTEALRAFQRKAAIAPSGRADPETVAALRSASSRITETIPDRDTPQPETHQPSTIIWPRQADVSKFYGPVGTGQIPIEIPFDMVLAWDKSKKIRRITVNEKVAPSAEHCFQRIAETYSEIERSMLGINIFGGSLNVRRMRGGSAYSMHSWGIAIDFDPERNQLHWGKDKARLANPDAIPFWLIWESQGWLSLGRSRNFDWMHIQAARL